MAIVNVTFLQPIGRPYHTYFALKAIAKLSGSNRTVALITFPIIFILGTFGNTASFLVMSSRRFRRFSYANYLMVLSVADLLLTISMSGMPLWDFALRNVNFSSLGQCLAYEFVFKLAYSWSTTIIVFITVERVLVVVFPFTSRVICTVKCSRRVMLVMVVPNFLVASHTFFGMRFSDELKCHYYSFYFQKQIYTYLNAFYYVGPSVLLIVCNLVIVIFMRRGLKVGETGRKTAKARRTTIMLMTVSLTFVVTTLPNTFTSFLPIPDHTVDYFYTIFTMVTTLNYSLNFYIYLLLGSEVRAFVTEKITCKTDAKIAR
ncbi:uncharacterized protein LOC141912924 [Tubulanus polymorphus]|uniref:uncharacterized protein LOC141912924 n=1 Tax=Tubulanus polymorphus TaxID=672921 RepID=UPI003DA41E98